MELRARHTFNNYVACEVGSKAAILFENIEIWCEIHRALGRNFVDGHYWVSMSAREMTLFFPYMSERGITSSLRLLEKNGFILKKKANSDSMDQTYCYSACENKSTFLDKSNYKPNKKPKVKTLTKVYLMRDNHTSLWKIGVSKDPKVRESTLLSIAPKTELVWCKRPKNTTAFALEKSLHELFDAKRVRGEWFDLTEKDVEYIKNLDI